MHRTLILLFVLLVLMRPASSVAQTETAGAPTAGTVVFGVRLFDGSGDIARAQRYRDLRTGPEIDRFQYQRDEQTWVFRASADHVGYRDQRYVASYQRAGRVKASFMWDQVPLFNSTVTSTPMTEVTPGVFRLDDSVQQGIQAGTLTLAAAVPFARTFDLRSRREIAAFNLTVAAARNLDLKLNVTSTARKGQQPWGVGFGFSNVVEVAAPLDDRTTDISTAAEWANSQGMLRIGYDGSWFQNSVESLTVDNPVRFSDAVGQASQGRMALWPSSSAHSINTAGSLKLPARSRATAYISVGNWQQDADLIPFTINTAITPIPLDRPTAQIDARITAMNYTLTSSPHRAVWLNARFKRYDFDNRTPIFHITNYVRTDQTVTASALGQTEPLGYVRDNFDADASFTPIKFTALRVGYGREEVSRAHRFFERTTDNTLRGTVDFTGKTWLTLRTVYEHSKRTGTGLDEEVLDQVGEQVTLRQFDISDRDRDRVSAVVQVTPIDELGITASITGGNDRRPDAEFGLKRNVHRVYAFSVDAVPSEKTLFGASYGFERYETAQNSRQATAGVQFLDATRNWSTEGLERVHTANVSADLLELAPKVEVRFCNDFTRSIRYTYVMPANSTLVAPSQLPAIFHELHHGVLDARYLIRPDLTLGLVYWHDRYRVDDFALDGDILNRIDMNAQVLLLMNSYRPYRTNTVTLRMAYLW